MKLRVLDDARCDARTAFASMSTMPYEPREPGAPCLRDAAVDGSLVLFRGRGVLSSAISWLSGSPYSHAGLVIRWDERVLVAEATYPAVRVTPLSIAVADYDGIADLYAPAAPLDREVRRKLVGLALAHLSVPFGVGDLGWLGVYRLIRRRFVEHDRPEDDLVCSELIARIYALAGHPLAGESVRACTDAACLARSGPTIDGQPAPDHAYASSCAPAQLLCSRRFVPVGRFDRAELGEVRARRAELVAEYVEQHRGRTRGRRRHRRK